MKAKVIKNIQINDKYGYMVIESKELCASSEAGKFFMVSPRLNNETNSDPLINRAFAIADIFDDDTILFIYQIVGRVTSMLTTVQEGDYLNVVGALGKRFTICESKNVALVAGGAGIAPMIILGKKLRSNGNKVTLFYGGASKKDIIPTEILSTSYDNLEIATFDGSLGLKGLVTKLLLASSEKFDNVYTCGPTGMLSAVVKAVSSIDENIDIEVSMEAKMGCGIGACLGCLIPTIDKDGTVVNRRCCVEGPIFDGKTISFERLV